MKNIFIALLPTLLMTLPVYAEEKLGDEFPFPAEEEVLFWGEEEKEFYVEAASRIREPGVKSPAIVNIITAEKIRDMGARNLLDILSTIPGFFDIQDINEHVVAGRGIYATSTHKFLLLRDGYRLNDPIFANIMPENSISLASIKRIEVLRGPGGSLYGNSSLLGIINIITVDEEEPSKASVGIGNFGQKTFDLVYNKPISDERQFLLFSSFYDSDGESISLGSERDFSMNQVSGKQDIDRRPQNYDIGVKYKRGGGMLSLSTRRSSYDTPRGNLGQFLTQSDTLVDPQQDFYNTNLNLTVMTESDDIEFDLHHYLDYSRMVSPQFSEVSRNTPPNGRAFNLEVDSIRGGIEYIGTYRHRGGTALAGFQTEACSLLNSKIETSFDDNTTLEAKKGLPQETEWMGAVYIQEKYNLLPNLLLNGGIRWDIYQAFGSSVNPRLAVVYNPLKRFYAKLIYATAFQSPFYFYRKENQGLGYGATTELRAEKMGTYQISLENWFNEMTWLRVALFHNHLIDLISKPAGASTYQNFGKAATEGIETEAKVEFRAITLFASHSYIRPVTDNIDASLTKDNELINIPNNIINGGLMWRYKPLSGSFYASWHDRIKSPIGTSSTSYRYEPDNEIPSRAIFNLTINAGSFYEEMEASLKIHNLFDERDWRGGTVLIPYPQEGRSILFTLGYRF